MGKWQSLAVSISLTAIMLSASAQAADSLDAQRLRYQQIKQAWDNQKRDVIAQLMPTLSDYPLYPYLEYRQLTQDLSQTSSEEVREFIARYPTFPLVATLSTRFINELANRQDWHGLVALTAEPPDSPAARCSFYYARWVTGEPQLAWEGAAALWSTGQTLPIACDRLFSVWQQAGLLTQAAIQQRLLLALQQNNTSLSIALIKQLDDLTLAKALTTLMTTPANLEIFAKTLAPTPFTRAVVTTFFARAVRQNVRNARNLLPSLVRLQKLSDAERLALEEMAALRLMGNDATQEEAQWRDAVLLRSQSISLLERRVRLALNNGDRQDLALWLPRLPAAAQQKDEWRYWRASLLLEQGQRQQGEAMLRELMKARGFYPMVAAQTLKLPYPVQIDTAIKPDATLSSRPEVARIRELIYWHQDNLARSEWGILLANSSRLQQEALARYAFEQQWADLSVQATIVAKLWNHLEERFPLAWSSEFQQATEGKSITPSYAMAIARQESAWNPQAQSAQGASGLMQLMPRTAQHTAQLNKIARYTDASQLFDPQVNIQLGTHYLEQVYQKFDRNRILSSAAYNAGPSRVNEWLNGRNKQIDAIAFVESIPFAETRNYVKNVLAYDLFYRHLMHQPTNILTDAEWERRY